MLNWLNNKKMFNAYNKICKLNPQKRLSTNKMNIIFMQCPCTTKKNLLLFLIIKRVVLQIFLFLWNEFFSKEMEIYHKGYIYIYIYKHFFLLPLSCGYIRRQYTRPTPVRTLTDIWLVSITGAVVGCCSVDPSRRSP